MNNSRIYSGKERSSCYAEYQTISDLRNYNEVLRDIAVGEPVLLTKNGRGRYVLADINEYEKLKASLKLMSQLAQRAGWKSKRMDEY